MSTTRRKRVYVGVIILAVAALAVDKFFLSEGQAAGLSPHGSTAPAEARGSVDRRPMSPEAVPTVRIPEVPFPRGLEPLDPSAGVFIRDFFAPPESALNRDPPDSQTDKSGRNANQPDRHGRLGRSTFVSRHRLSGVLLDQRLKIAIVDGTWLRIGQSLNGCTLASVSGNEARFECYDGEAVLEIINKKIVARH